MFQRCAEQWRRRFLEEDFAPPAIPVLVGRTVREVALAALRRKLDADAFPSPEELADLAADAFNRRAAEGVYVAPEELSSVRASSPMPKTPRSPSSPSSAPNSFPGSIPCSPMNALCSTSASPCP